MYLETIAPELAKIIQKVSVSKLFSEFRLCGGTALSLQLGHRISVDADFVVEHFFDKEELLKNIQELFPNATDIHQGTHGIFLKVEKIKVDFLSWDMPFTRPAQKIKDWSLLHIEEIAAMKLFAILQRGEKKDYVDVATLLKIYSLQELISFYQERHKGGDASVIIRFLSSYSDLDFQPEPWMLNNSNWAENKKIIQEAVRTYVG